MSDVCETKDVEEAAYLATAGFQIQGTRLSLDTNRPILFFKLEVPDGVEVGEVRRTYTNRKAGVEPKLYAECLRDMQNILHDALRKVRYSTREQ